MISGRLGQTATFRVQRRRVAVDVLIRLLPTGKRKVAQTKRERGNQIEQGSPVVCRHVPVDRNGAERHSDRSGIHVKERDPPDFQSTTAVKKASLSGLEQYGHHPAVGDNMPRLQPVLPPLGVSRPSVPKMRTTPPSMFTNTPPSVA